MMAQSGLCEIKVSREKEITLYPTVLQKSLIRFWSNDYEGVGLNIKPRHQFHLYYII